MVTALLFTPLYIFVFLIVALLYILGAFVLGVIGSVLTLPVLYYSGYGLVPPQLTPANAGDRLFTAAVVHLVLGGLFGVGCLFVVFFTRSAIPFLVRYQFARISPRLEVVPALAVSIGIVFAFWLGYLVYGRGKFSGDEPDGQLTALLTSIRAAAVFCVCFVALAVLTSATLAL